MKLGAWRGCMMGIALLSLGTPARAAEPLQPFQMVRSLQLVQDRIAAGDHAALPMQRKLLEMIDRRFKQSTASDFDDKRNFRAVLVYGMSGGNPATIRRVLSGLTLDPADKAIGDGIVSYLQGKPKAAQTALAATDPLAFPPELGAFIALVKGSTVSLEEPKAAMPLLDTARLLAPGTLVEEAALRRQVDIATSLGDPQRFIRISGQYVRYYLRSPYASQFADAFVSGVIAMHGDIKPDALADITANMDPDQEKVIYLRIARRSAIDGLKDLSAFASARAEGGMDSAGDMRDPRALLYSSLATVTSANMPDMLAKLDRIDRSKLTASDRELLEAVRAVAAGVTQPAQANDMPSTAPTAPPIAEESKGPPAVEMADEAPDQPDGADDAAQPDTREAGTQSEPTQPSAIAAASTASQPPDPATAIVTDARQKLEAIDKLLQETTD